VGIELEAALAKHDAVELAEVAHATERAQKAVEGSSDSSSHRRMTSRPCSNSASSSPSKSSRQWDTPEWRSGRSSAPRYCCRPLLATRDIGSSRWSGSQRLGLHLLSHQPPKLLLLLVFLPSHSGYLAQTTWVCRDNRSRACSCPRKPAPSETCLRPPALHASSCRRQCIVMPRPRGWSSSHGKARERSSAYGGTAIQFGCIGSATTNGAR
jgi:hypothetical protein